MRFGEEVGSKVELVVQDEVTNEECLFKSTALVR